MNLQVASINNPVNGIAVVAICIVCLVSTHLMYHRQNSPPDLQLFGLQTIVCSHYRPVVVSSTFWRSVVPVCCGRGTTEDRILTIRLKPGTPTHLLHSPQSSNVPTCTVFVFGSRGTHNSVSLNPDSTQRLTRPTPPDAVTTCRSRSRENPYCTKQRNTQSRL